MSKKDFWKNKNVLFIGDSITYALSNAYPKHVCKLLGCNFEVHGKPGAQIKTMIDGDIDGNDPFFAPIKPICAKDFEDKDLVVLFGGFNNRWFDIGCENDVYNPQNGSGNTIYGLMQYSIDRIKQELVNANNPNCPLLVVTVYFCGKYSWNCYPADVKPPKYGCSFRDIAKVQIEVANKNGLAYCDLYEGSDIRPETWSIYCASPNPVNEKYTPYLLEKNGNKVNDEFLTYQTGKKYYQIRNGKVVLEQYEDACPYPFNGDQLHLNQKGYEHIASLVANSILQIK